jgi:N-methylhydantoinase A
VLLDDGAAEVAVHRRTELRAGHAIAGPALVDQDDTTTFVPRGWRGQVHAAGSLVLERSA